MHNFNTKQKVINIAGTKIGGQLGEYPTVMCGSIFYSGHNIVIDPREGLFDKDSARKLLSDELHLSKEFGLPQIIDVIGETGKALINHLKFVLEETECPVFVDSPNTKAILEAFYYFKGSTIMQRLTYNSIDTNYKESDLKDLKVLGVKNAVVLAFAENHFRAKERLTLLLGDEWQQEHAGTRSNRGLESATNTAG